MVRDERPTVRDRRIWLLLAGMAVGLALFYRGGSLPLVLTGIILFGALALLRPDLGLLFVPLCVPLYIIPASIPGVRASGFLLPLHEVALVLVTGAYLLRFVGSYVRQSRSDYSLGVTARGMSTLWLPSRS